MMNENHLAQIYKQLLFDHPQISSLADKCSAIYFSQGRKPVTKKVAKNGKFLQNRVCGLCRDERLPGSRGRQGKRGSFFFPTPNRTPPEY